MQVSELIEILSDMNPDAEVRLAVQPSYPLQHEVGNVVEANECDRCELDENSGLQMTECPACDAEEEIDGDACPECHGDGYVECGHGGGDATTVYIGEGGHCGDPYLSGAAASELGWK